MKLVSEKQIQTTSKTYFFDTTPTPDNQESGRFCFKKNDFKKLTSNDFLTILVRNLDGSEKITITMNYHDVVRRMLPPRDWNDYMLIKYL